MKTATMLWSLVAIVAAGCGGSGGGSSEEQTNATPAASAVSAPADYLGAMAKAKQKAVKTVDLASLTQAIQMFQVSEGRFPKDLNELVTQKYLTKVPDPPYGHKLVYNPTDGQVSVVPN